MVYATEKQTQGIANNNKQRISSWKTLDTHYTMH